MEDFEEKKYKTAVLLGAGTESKEELLRSLTELERLADTAGIQTLEVCYQSFKEQTKATYIGSGKVEEVAEVVKRVKPDVVIVDEMIKAFQLRNLAEAFGVDVIDRYMLVLDIFSQRAKTAEGKLQVEIAQLKYNMSRISLVKEDAQRFKGGNGARGPGEKATEIAKRAFRAKLQGLQEKVDSLKQQRELSRSKRKHNNEKLVAIVGYTNAGKSTLLNTLAKDNIYADDKLFATLDTTTRKIYLDYKHSFLITDTVGFISKLPHDLIEAFQATLEEANSANCILNVVDCSDKNALHHIEVTQNTLKQVGAENIPVIYVLNKADLCEDFSAFEGLDYVKISAKTGENIELLKQKIASILFPDFEYVIYK